MTDECIRTVQSTWLEVLPIKDAVAQLFYEGLVGTNPSLRSLF
jgi:hypothetical protein